MSIKIEATQLDFMVGCSVLSSELDSPLLAELEDVLLDMLLHVLLELLLGKLGFGFPACCFRSAFMIFSASRGWGLNWKIIDSWSTWREDGCFLLGIIL